MRERSTAVHVDEKMNDWRSRVQTTAVFHSYLLLLILSVLSLKFAGVTNFFKEGKKRCLLTEKSLRRKNIHAWQTIVFVKQEKIKKRIIKAYYGKNENVTHVNIFFGGTIPFPQGIFMQSWKGGQHVRSIFPKSVTIDMPSAYVRGCVPVFALV